MVPLTQVQAELCAPDTDANSANIALTLSIKQIMNGSQHFGRKVCQEADNNEKNTAWTITEKSVLRILSKLFYCNTAAVSS